MQSAAVVVMSFLWDNPIRHPGQPHLQAHVRPVCRSSPRENEGVREKVRLAIA